MGCLEAIGILHAGRRHGPLPLVCIMNCFEELIVQLLAKEEGLHWHSSELAQSLLWIAAIDIGIVDIELGVSLFQ